MRTGLAFGFAPLCIVGAILAGAPSRAGAGEFEVGVGARGAYDGYYELDDHLPARRPAGPKVTVVTERRVVTTEPVFGPARHPPGVVSTRRVVRTEPVGALAGEDEIETTGGLAEVGPPRRMVRTIVARQPLLPVTKEVVTTRRVVAPPPVAYYGERRQVITTRRIVTTEPAVDDEPETVVTRRYGTAALIEDVGSSAVVTTRRVVRQPEW